MRPPQPPGPGGQVHSRPPATASQRPLSFLPFSLAWGPHSCQPGSGHRRSVQFLQSLL